MIRRWAFIDCWSLTALLFRERKRFDEIEPEGDVKSFELTRGMLKDAAWANAKTVVNRVTRALTTPEGVPTYNRIFIESLLPFGCRPWQQDPEYAKEFLTFHLPIVTNPGAMLYSGLAADNPPPGWLTFVDYGVRNSALNSSDLPRYHLVLEVQRPTGFKMNGQEAEPGAPTIQ